MKYVKKADYESACKHAAELIIAQINKKTDSVLGLATGSTPLGVYENLVLAYREGRVDFSEVKTFNLDEYCDISPDNPQSYHYYMEENLFSKINIRPENIFIPKGDEAEEECGRYEEKLRISGGIDLQLLGIGHNGHIGFNEPAKEFSKGVHKVQLDRQTLEANTRFFASVEEVPREAYTMGISNIFAAKKILLLAFTESKAEILKQATKGAITPNVPASILQLHGDVTVITDQNV